MQLPGRSKKAYKQQPTNIDALTCLGDVYAAQKDYGDAIEVYNEVLEKDPKNEEALEGKNTALKALQASQKVSL